MDDPRRVQEQQRRKAGLPRSLRLTRTAKSHPRVGGARGYSVPMRESELWLYNHGFPTVSSVSSLRRWDLRLHPFIMIGNKERIVITVLDQYNLILFLLAWPEARLDKIIVFLANTGCCCTPILQPESHTCLKDAVSQKWRGSLALKAYSFPNIQRYSRRAWCFLRVLVQSHHETQNCKMPSQLSFSFIL